MSEHRFTLEPYQTKKTLYLCPRCLKKKLTRYIDIFTNEYINEDVGRCSRIVKCAYHYPPKSYFNDNKHLGKQLYNKAINHPKLTKPQVTSSTSFIDEKLVNLSLQKSNNLIQFLETKLFGKEITDELIDLYKIGTSKHRNSSTVFWQIDIENKVRSGKVMLYNSITGKRIRKTHPNWVHSLLKIENFNLTQCLFGEHLLANNNKPVAIVESEKTAIISSVYLPEFVWLACGGLNNLNKEKTEVLKDRNVVLFPDLKCFNLWKKRIPTLSQNAKYIVSDLLEKKATPKEKEKGYDLADYLINLNIDYKKYV